MSKLLGVVVIGALLGLVPFFFFFVGIKVHYIDYYGIKEYFNILFVDQISWKWYAVVSLVLGILFIFTRKLYLASLVFLLVLAASLSSFIPEIALAQGKKLFAKENFHIKKGRHLYKGILLYEGRHHYYIRKADNNRTIPFRKDEVDETY